MNRQIDWLTTPERVIYLETSSPSVFRNLLYLLSDELPPNSSLFAAELVEAGVADVAARPPVELRQYAREGLTHQQDSLNNGDIYSGTGYQMLAGIGDGPIVHLSIPVMFLSSKITLR